MSIITAIAWLQTKALTLSGMKAAPNNPPEAMNVFPFAVCYVKSGDLLGGSYGWSNVEDILVLEIHLTRQNLPGAIAAALPYRDLVVKELIKSPTLGGTVSTITDVSWLFGYLAWGGTNDMHIGWQFNIGIKQELTI